MLQRGAGATAPGDAARDRMRSRIFAEFEPPTQASQAVPTSQTTQAVSAPGVPPTQRPSPVPRTPVTTPATADPEPGITHRTVIPAPKRAGHVTGTKGRLLIALGATFCLVLALSGMTLLLSRNALPGDPLYAVRRTVESATLGLTVGDDSKGTKHLEYAADRIGDIESLATRYPDPADSPVGDYLTAFADFDSDAGAGTADLTAYATSHAMGGLTTLRDWAAQQSGRIEVVEPRLPTAARQTATASVGLLARIATRASALLARDNCYTITSGRGDALGELPATGPCDSGPGSTSSQPGHSGGAVDGTTAPAQVPTPDGAVPQTPPDERAAGLAVTSTTFPTPPVYAPPGRDTQGATPTTTQPSGTIAVPLPLPGLTLPPLLPGLPGIKIGQ
jgi:Domain of unknown function (DUF5667)